MAEASSSTHRRRSQAQISKIALRSDVWNHFTRFTDGDGRAKARCKHCPQVLGAETKSGTSTLWAHWNRHEQREEIPGEESPQQTPPPLPPAGPEEAARGDLARMIALHGYNPSVVKDDYFRSFLCRLNPEYEVPSRLAIEEMCDAIFDETMKGLFSKLHDVPGKVSIAVGTVRTIRGNMLYTACHFIDDQWNLHKIIMDVYADVPFLNYHGPLLGVDEVCLDRDLSRDISIDKVMVRFKAREVLHNLFMMIWETKGNDINLEYELRNEIEDNPFKINPNRRQLFYTTYMDNVIHSIARLLVMDPEFKDDYIISDLENLHLTRQERHQLLSQLGLDYDLWAYDEKWYSEYCSMEVLRKKGSAITNTVFAELLCMLWGEIYRSIQRISAPDCPTSSNLCLIELFKLREVFKHQLAQASGENAIAYNEFNGCFGAEDHKDVADVLTEAMVAIDKAIQDSYPVWSIPLVLDPRYKLARTKFIFQTAFSTEAAADYISEVTRNITELYSDYVEDDDSTMNAVAVGSTDPLQEAWDEHRRAEAQTDLDRYLKDELVHDPAQGFDILSWWKVHGSVLYPRVAQMARDALAMPTCSKPSAEQLAHITSIVRGYSKEGFV
ncbi:zinc finger BED domain-containing protein RICESLEEPER 1-like [Oryza sativa Japonica Group]|jgi:hypothetical protein|uniref:zinc finger BED domain-containing protein RICESLEEPER 1-like n=1 Tax=Oryza sativa subsp. japonica TaxID=39947 RepID=UPI0007754349|nr:zinc finger BED domain-containing protein RICESLEEPER 1-like [Oryza sativa Japonica Group]XP_015619044.1 zinc finger BED domain-containing protein RICESLEEPER 1-like [Oryza sativa Japonica Group]KAF2907064.1 hypothetical protein DAI22_12g067600 [Oryza sativa Japonica Group]KAF2907065.1 hypothetical protein DAI22_12g067600 [Oryza sativa Japonica Group]